MSELTRTSIAVDCITILSKIALASLLVDFHGVCPTDKGVSKPEFSKVSHNASLAVSCLVRYLQKWCMKCDVQSYANGTLPDGFSLGIILY